MSGWPIAHIFRHPDTALLSISPGRRFSRPTPERASQCPEWDDERPFGLPVVGATALVYQSHFFSVYPAQPMTRPNALRGGRERLRGYPHIFPPKRFPPIFFLLTGPRPAIEGAKARRLVRGHSGQGPQFAEFFRQPNRRLPPRSGPFGPGSCPYKNRASGTPQPFGSPNCSVW